MRVDILGAVVRSLTYGDRHLFQGAVTLGRRWGWTKAVANTVVLSLVLWPLALRTGDLSLAILPVGVGVWYLLRIARFSSGILNDHRLRRVRYVGEVVLFSTLLVYLAAAFQVARAELSLLYVWPLDALAVSYPKNLRLVIASFFTAALGILVVNFVAHGVGGPQTCDALASAIWLALLLLALRHSELQLALANHWEERAVRRWQGSRTYLEVFERLTSLAASETQADIVVLYPYQGGDVTPFLRTVRTTVLDGLDYLTVGPVGPRTTSDRVINEYRSPRWKRRRESGERSLIHQWGRAGETDPVFGGAINSHGEPSFAARQSLVSTAALVLAPHGDPSDIWGVMFLNYRRRVPFSSDETHNLDHLAQILALDLATADRHIEEAARVADDRRQLELDRHADLFTNMNIARISLQAIADSGYDSQPDFVDLTLERASRALTHIEAAWGFAERLWRPRASDVSTDRAARVRAFTDFATDSHRSGPRASFKNWIWPDLFGSDERAWQVFEIVKEAVMNAITHSKADQVVVDVSVGTDGQASEVVVWDDGIGLPEKLPGGGLGFLVMHRAAGSIGAWVRVGQHMPKGAEIRLVLRESEDRD